MDAQSSALQMTALRMMKNMSLSVWHLQRSMRGLEMEEKWSTMEAVGWRFIKLPKFPQITSKVEFRL